MTDLFQARFIQVINGQTYLVDGGGGRPPIGPLPNLRKAFQAGFEVFNDSRLPPDSLDSRDRIPRPYKPTHATSGILGRYEDYTEYNSPDTTTLVLNKGTTFPAKSIVYGDVSLGSTSAWADGEDVLFRGGSHVPTKETAVIDANYKYGTAQNRFNLRDVTIDPQVPCQNRDNIKGHRVRGRRLELVHGVDGAGIFTSPYGGGDSGRATDFALIDSIISDLMYYPGALYANANTGYLNSSGGYGTAGSTSVLRAPRDAGWIDDGGPGTGSGSGGHKDGNHSDCIEVQIALGFMTYAQAVALHTASSAELDAYLAGSEEGRGVYLKNLTLRANDAMQNNGLSRDPTGKGLPIAGLPGSRSGSFPGFGDNPKRGVPQAPGMTRPVVNAPKRLGDGQYAANGSALILVQNTGQAFQYPTTQFPDRWSVVADEIHMDDYHIGLNTQDKGVVVGGVAVPLRAILWDLSFGPNVYQFGGPSIFPVRIYDADSQFAPLPDGRDAMESWVWDDPDNVWGRDGLRLINSKTGGIQIG